MTDVPETRYARTGDWHVAYQVIGEGPLDLVMVPGWVSHLELEWENAYPTRFFRRLASFSRLIRFDKLGTGVSDRVAALPPLEERMDEMRAVMDAVGSERAALFGFSEGGTMAAMFAATYPERTLGLILLGTFARRIWAPDYPWGKTLADWDAGTRWSIENWGQGRAVPFGSPSLAGDPDYVKWRGRLERSAASPGTVQGLMRMIAEIDGRHVLPTIRVPTLVLHRIGDMTVEVGNGRYLGENIPAAKYVELPGNDHQPWSGDYGAICDEMQSFLTGARSQPETERVLATVLFTDIVGSTERAAEIGDRAWRELLDQHHFLVRQQLERHRGREIDTAGDGFFAAFDGPARAVRCAQAIAGSVRSLGLRVRAGVHTGECEVMGRTLGGIAVHIGARVAAAAEADEVLVSSTVKDLVAGSGLRFEPRGARSLKGVPGEWTLFAAA